MSQQTRKQVPMKTAIQKQTEKALLDQTQVKLLIKQQSEGLGVMSPAKRRRLWSLVSVACVACCVIVLSTYQLLPTYHSEPMIAQSVQDIADEVILNHLKRKPLEVHSNQMKQAQKFFTLLDFLPIQSEVLTQQFLLSERQMLGGRYCSIKGVSAVQLRYQTNGDQVSTFYEVDYDPSIFGPIPNIDQGEVPQEIYRRGLRVSLWVEKGLFMVLVSSK